MSISSITAPTWKWEMGSDAALKHFPKVFGEFEIEIVGSGK